MRRESWIITCFDVEYGRELAQVVSKYFIGARDRNILLPTVLFFMTSSARVFEGTWNKTRLAVKVLRTSSGIAPSKEVRIGARIQRIYS